MASQRQSPSSTRRHNVTQPIPSEHVLVVPRGALFRHGTVRGFSNSVGRYIETIGQDAFFAPRDQVEDDPNLKQIIPYVVLRYGGPHLPHPPDSAGGGSSAPGQVLDRSRRPYQPRGRARHGRPAHSRHGARADGRSQPPYGLACRPYRRPQQRYQCRRPGSPGVRARKPRA